jgi:hypothetical protein
MAREVGDPFGSSQALRPRKRLSLANKSLLLLSDHLDQHALTLPRAWMTAPSVITPRSANKVKKAKQVSGTASASHKNRFMVKCVCLGLRRPTEF